MNSINDIVDIADLRLKEAEVLYENNLYDGCIYLVGYCVELLLKARIAMLLDLPNMFVTLGRDVIRPFKIHRLADLAIYAGLQKKLSESDNETFKRYWSLLISNWSEELRYEKCSSCTQEQAQNLLKAIKDEQNGIQKWIKEQL